MVFSTEQPGLANLSFHREETEVLADLGWKVLVLQRTESHSGCSGTSGIRLCLRDGCGCSMRRDGNCYHQSLLPNTLELAATFLSWRWWFWLRFSHGTWVTRHLLSKQTVVASLALNICNRWDWVPGSRIGLLKVGVIWKSSHPDCNSILRYPQSPPPTTATHLRIQNSGWTWF